MAREEIAPDEVGEKIVAVPGTLTSAYLALKLFAPRAATRADRLLAMLMLLQTRQRLTARQPREPAPPAA